MNARRFVVHGVVQGVGFRWATRAAARRLGVAGWVRNRPDGTVEVWAEAAGDRLDAFEAWLHDGPPSARVSTVVPEPAAAAALDGFEIRS